MLKVLVHLRRFLLSFVTCFALFSHLVAGQNLVNGQLYTNGLAIIDSPSPLNPGHAGSPISIAIDVSGNGNLRSASSIPGSGLSTGYQLLEIYLVSSETNINMTVSSGPGLLTGEPGSTVKHLNWPIPPCIPAGNYNLTFYESSFFNNEGIFTITPILIPISNPNPSGPCPNLNSLQVQPQSSSPLVQSPFLAPPPPGSASGSASALRIATVFNPPSVTITLTLSNGILNLPTVTVTAQPSPTTVVVISMATVTETNQGTVTTYTQTSTITTVVTPSGPPDNTENNSGFIPVNAGSHLTSFAPLCLFFAAWTLSCVLLYSRMF